MSADRPRPPAPDSAAGSPAVAGRLYGAAASDALGAAIAPLLQAGDFIALSGPLGAGKSHLARALIRARLAAALGPAAAAREDIPSPSYTLLQTYEMRPPLLHADLYRLAGPEEAEELGLLDAPSAEDAAAPILLVEWAERLGPALPARRLALTLDLAGADARTVTLTAAGSGWTPLLEAAKRALSGSEGAV